MRATVVDLVTPHLLRVVDLASQAQNGAKVDWHVRDAVSATVRQLGEQFNAASLMGAYVDGLEAAASQAPKGHVTYADTLRAAATSARSLWRD